MIFSSPPQKNPNQLSDVYKSDIGNNEQKFELLYLKLSMNRNFEVHWLPTKNFSISFFVYSFWIGLSFKSL